MKALFVEKGWSACQITQFTGWSKSSIVEALCELGLKRPPKPHVKEPYGWKLSKGKLVPHVREQKIVHKIVQLSAKGHRPNRIATILNDQDIPTKNRKR